MSADTSRPADPDFVWTDGLTDAEPAVDWLWHGYLAGGAVTLLTSQWKAGKTTLVSLLLARLAAGGELAGRAVKAGTAAVVSEESPAMWRRRHDQLGFGPNLCWLCRPFRARPTPEQWAGLVDRLTEFRRRFGLSLAVIDPLASFLPVRSESDAAAVLTALAPLHQLTEAGAAVLLLHHPRKGSVADGQAARGSGALSGFADVVMEMSHTGRASAGDRRRVLVAYSRFEETPRRQVIELSADGRDYAVRGDTDTEAFDGGWGVVRAILLAADEKLTRREIRERWPVPGEEPSDKTLWRWLDRAVSQGLVKMQGAGRRNSAYRYWLPECEEAWRRDPLRLRDIELPEREPSPYQMVRLSKICIDAKMKQWADDESEDEESARPGDEEE
jgi:AAA domain